MVTNVLNVMLMDVLHVLVATKSLMAIARNALKYLVIAKNVIRRNALNVVTMNSLLSMVFVLIVLLLLVKDARAAIRHIVSHQILVTLLVMDVLSIVMYFLKKMASAILANLKLVLLHPPLLVFLVMILTVSPFISKVKITQEAAVKLFLIALHAIQKVHLHVNLVKKDIFFMVVYANHATSFMVNPVKNVHLLLAPTAITTKLPFLVYVRAASL